MNREQRIRNSIKSDKVNIIASGDLAVMMFDELEQCVKDAGLKDVDLEYWSATIAGWLKEYHFNLSINEVKLAFEWGAYGQYGEFYGINIRTVNLWMKGYIKEKREMFTRIREGSNVILSTQEKLRFLYKNIDKLPSLKVLLDKQG